MSYPQEVLDTADHLVRRYPVARSALLPLLHLLQSHDGYVTDDAIAFCAERLGLTRAEVGAVSTFYTMFKREPVGDWLISICTNPTCKIAGAQTIYERFQERLGGHYDPETGVSVEHAECLGICDAAPVIQVNYEMYGPLPDAEVNALLEGCRQGEPPVSSWSGERPGTFKQVEWDFSGAGDTWGDELVRAARQQVEAQVPPAYRTGETDLPVTHPGGDPKGHGGEVFRARSGRTTDAGRLGAEPPESDREAAGDVAEEVGGVAAERAEQVAGPGTGASPAAEDQPATAGAGDEPAEQSGEKVDATDEGAATRQSGEGSAPEPDEMPASRDQDATGRNPDMTTDDKES